MGVPSKTTSRAMVSGLVVVFVLLSSVVADKTLYLIRHGDSEWNDSNFLKQGLDAIFTFSKDHAKWSHRASYTDAPLTHKGMLDALKLCQAIYSHVEIENNHRCVKLAELVGKAQGLKEKTAWAPMANVLGDAVPAEVGAPRVHDDLLHLDDVVIDDRLTHATILSGTQDGTTTFYTSNLVRAIDTLFLSILPTIMKKGNDNIRLHLDAAHKFKVLATNYAQEVGKGWDGSMHIDRMRCDDVADYRSVCVKKTHSNQLDSFASLETKVISGELAPVFVQSMILQHLLFYSDILAPATTDDNEFFKYLKERKGASRETPEVQAEMFTDFISLVNTATTPNVVVAGHSHYFGHMLATKSGTDAAGRRCKAFGAAMQANGAVWRVRWDSTHNVITDCTIVYGAFKKSTELTNQYLVEDIPAAAHADHEELLSALEQDLNDLFASH